MKHMMILYRILFAVAALFTITSCNAPSKDEQTADLDQAQALIEQTDYRSAQSICDEVRHLQSKENVRDARILGRLSILYMKLSDVGDHEENVEYAYQCFLEAFSVDSVAAQEYYNSLSLDDMQQGVLLAGIVRSAINVPSPEIMVEDDSISTDSIM